MPEQSNDYRVVVFGAGGVGKSSLVLRFIKGTFRESYIPTIEDTYRQVNFIYVFLHIYNLHPHPPFFSPKGILRRIFNLIFLQFLFSFRR